MFLTILTRLGDCGQLAWMVFVIDPCARSPVAARVTDTDASQRLQPVFLANPPGCNGVSPGSESLCPLLDPEQHPARHHECDRVEHAPV